MDLFTFEDTTRIDGNADAYFTYITTWATYKHLGFPFTRILNLPDGQMKTGQEVDLIARYFLFFKTEMYLNVIQIDAANKSWDTYTVQNNMPATKSCGRLVRLSPSQFEYINETTVETRDQSIADTVAHYTRLQAQRLVKHFSKIY